MSFDDCWRLITVSHFWCDVGCLRNHLGVYTLYTSLLVPSVGLFITEGKTTILYQCSTY